MTKCAAITRAGQPCRGLVGPGSDYCPAHDPERSEARCKSASKAGRAKATTLPEIKRQLKQLADDVLKGKTDRGDGSVVAQIYGVLLRAFEQERKERELAEVEERLVQLEEAQAASRGQRQWGR